MATDTTVNELVINKLTQAQYDALIEKSPTELYFVTDAKDNTLPLDVIDSVEKFPQCTVEDLGKLVIYTGPTTESTQESVQLVLDGTIYNGHIFGCIEVNVTTENESVAYYMWKDVYESLPTIGDDVAGKVLSNNGLYLEWVDMPEGDKLPDQTDNAGKFLMTDGTTASWGGGKIDDNSVAIGKSSSAYTTGVALGDSAKSNSMGSIALGSKTSAEIFATAIGCNAKATTKNAIQLGSASTYVTGHTNSDANTFKVGNENGNFEIMSADGTIPTDRYTITPTDAGTYVPKLTIAEDGTATREWGTESSGDWLSKAEAAATYLPLSGGSIDHLTFTNNANYIGFKLSGSYKVSMRPLNPEGLTTTAGLGLSETILSFGWDDWSARFKLFLDTGTQKLFPAADNSFTLGLSERRWGNVYTHKLNNGADIAVPTTGGTMVVATPPTDNGTYVLKATVVDGVVTTEWVLEA